ncbi:PITH domain-containing protein [Bombardia bombarda]|uniref:PITH domain-containing protein n=1 Tax=Bombardia bombarda TaxID=252184 RepID=A0AA40C567_9PEZI|nr:PITH domain-containing protein [Bombardia bombarda]
MSKPVVISSTKEFNDLLQSSKIVVADFYTDWCGPCNAAAPHYEKLSQALSRPNLVTFVKVHTEQQQELARTYDIRVLPTFIFFRNGQAVETIKGGDQKTIQSAVQKLAAEVGEISAGKGSAAEASGSGSDGNSGATWMGAPLPGRNFTDVTDQIEKQRCELLNVSSEAGGVRELFDGAKPSALSGGKTTTKDWVQSDTDEQLLLFVPFQSMLKLQNIQITSLPPTDGDDENVYVRPRTVKLFTNKPHNLSFDDASDMTAIQVIELSEKSWNKDGTADIPLRYVRFQNINSLVLFVVNGDSSSGEDGDSDYDSDDDTGKRVRIDRIRLIGEAGEKREMGKLEKIGDEPGE